MNLVDDEGVEEEKGYVIFETLIKYNITDKDKIGEKIKIDLASKLYQ